ncbi:MAG: leucyl aminopeptidase [Deltaproteobacteria bacterium]|nr:leucyl aminopeptidase [Candidatus Zymogenaceae bacterium]
MKKTISAHLPKLIIVHEDPIAVAAPALALGIFSKGDLPPLASAIDKKLGGHISRIISDGDFTGGDASIAVIYPPKDSGVKADRIILVGLGKRENLSLRVLKARAAAAAKRALGLKVAGLTLPFDLGTGAELDAAEYTDAVVLGAMLGAYRFKEFKGKKKSDDEENKDKHIETLTLIGKKDVEISARRARVVADCVYLARDLSNSPANHLTPSSLASRARDLGKKFGLIVDIYAKAEIEKMGMGSFLSVSRGSHEPPALIVMSYLSKKKGINSVALVGKGITFDSGGISLKPSLNMDQMKTDMSGGCAVFATVLAAARLGLDTDVVGVIPATENMPGGGATKPGDVVTAMDGTTIEVLNTDAEGRLVLADGICFAKRYKPAVIIDLATLTGAAVVALGGKTAPLFSTDEGLLGRLQAASEASGERVWPMPLFEYFERDIKSDVADIKNIGKGREAGSIIGATFLKHFAGKEQSWAHVDIAGTARADGDYEWVKKGSTGFGVMLLVKYLERLDENGRL